MLTRIVVVFGFAAAFSIVSSQAAAAGPAAGGVCAAQRVAAPPAIPGEFILSDFVVFVDEAGVLWVKLFPETPWDATPPSEWFSDYVQVAITEQGTGALPSILGFQTHDGQSETFSFIGTGPGPVIQGYIMNDGALLFNTGFAHGGGTLDVNLRCNRSWPASPTSGRVRCRE